MGYCEKEMACETSSNQFSSCTMKAVRGGPNWEGGSGMTAMLLCPLVQQPASKAHTSGVDIRIGMSQR